MEVLPQQAPVLLTGENVIQLGAARFRFEIEHTAQLDDDER
jgi:hypothetical protein